MRARQNSAGRSKPSDCYAELEYKPSAGCCWMGGHTWSKSSLTSKSRCRSLSTSLSNVAVTCSLVTPPSMREWSCRRPAGQCQDVQSAQRCQSPSSMLLARPMPATHLLTQETGRRASQLPSP